MASGGSVKRKFKLIVLLSAILSASLYYYQYYFKMDLKLEKIRRIDEVELIDQALEISDYKLLEEYKEKLREGKIVPSNWNFIFHNKLPKCGSTTLNYILLALSKRNKFHYEKINAGSMANTIQEDGPVVRYVENNFKPPYLLLKHQFWVNFTGLPKEMQPTYINLIRDPLEWVTSRYYFNRYGWERDPGCRGEGCSMSKEEFDMSIDECVEKRMPLCTSPSPYFPYLCGPSSACSKTAKNEVVYELTRKRLLENYFFVGILEHFEETLRALETLLPIYFEGAVDIWKSDQIQKKQRLTVTKKRRTMSNVTRQYYLNGPLKYEAKLYNYAKMMFRERLSSIGIPLPEEVSNS